MLLLKQKHIVAKEKLEIAFTFQMSPLKFDIYVFGSDESKKLQINRKCL